MIPVAITAAPRPDEPADLQSRCLTSVLDAGFTDVTVYAEPDREAVYPQCYYTDCRLFYNRQRLGEWRNWLNSVHDTLLVNPQAQHIITMQDDILWCKGVADWVDQWLSSPVNHPKAVHLYTSRAYRQLGELGVFQIPLDKLGKMAGACGILWPRAFLINILDYAYITGWRGSTVGSVDEPYKKEGLDTFLGLAIAERQFISNVFACLPSFGEHVSHGSTLGHGSSTGNRRAANFAGGDAVALEVLPC